MGITDKIDNKVKRSKSVSNEKKAINQRMDDITEATEGAREQIMLIGQYFWKKYIAGEYVPEEGNKTYFDNLDRLNDRVRDLTKEIDDLKLLGIREREIIDEETRQKIRVKEDLKAEKAEAKRKAKEAQSGDEENL